MRFLHTSDWHIGQVFKTKSRLSEHKMFFKWLKNTIIQNEVEVLLVAGDIFDTPSPSTSALKIYYDFLVSLQETCCRYIIITGGNHDGISTLDAPKELLKTLNITLISGEKNSLEDKNNIIIPLYDKKNKLSTIVCAIPFLRDSSIRASNFEQTSKDIEKQLRDGIKNYYSDSLKKAKELSSSAKIIAMGHLSVVGSSVSDSERELYIGKLKSLNSSIFDGYDYVALGHIHQPQVIAKNKYIRYSGSPIDLSFSEIRAKKMVLLVDVEESNIEVNEVFVPKFRELFHIRGNLENILNSLENISKKMFELEPFVEVSVEGEFVANDIVSKIYEYTKEMNLEVLAINSQNKEKEIRNDVDVKTLDELTPFKTFMIKCDENKELLSGDIRELVVDCFKEVEEMLQNENTKTLS